VAAAATLSLPRVVAISPELPTPWPDEPPQPSPAVVVKVSIAPPKTERTPVHYQEFVIAAAKLYHVSARLIHAVIMVESNYRADAVSPVGAQGLMQLMPQTAARYGLADPFDPAANIAAGARHLSSLLARFDNDLALALAAYNAGEGAVLRHGGIPPYPETERYVARVLEYYGETAEHARLPSSPPGK
jgi:soluble lytic murein transglycosylase-like protein